MLCVLSEASAHHFPDSLWEVVDLLQESGIERCDEWLGLLQDSEMNRDVLQRVAYRITKNSRGDDDKDDEILEVRDSTVTSAATLLPLIPHKEVKIALHRKETPTTELWQAIKNHSCTRLYLHHHYKHPSSPPASDSLLAPLPKSHLRNFMGHLSAGRISSLQECQQLVDLDLAVSSDIDAPTILSTLSDVRPKLAQLSFLTLHVPIMSVTAEVLTTPLPDVFAHDLPGVYLMMSEMDEHLLEKASRIAIALQPRMGEYRVINFPGCKMSVTHWKRLIELLADAKVRVRGSLWLLANMLEEEEYRELRTLARRNGLGGIYSRSEEKLWRW